MNSKNSEKLMYSMLNIKPKKLLILLMSMPAFLHAQVLPLDSVLALIERNNSMIQMYDAKASALNTYAEGATAWEAPKIGTGFWMAPYNPNLWRVDPQTGAPGMGSYMISVEQMIPNNQKLKARQSYMQSMSGEQTETKNYIKNQLFAEAGKTYYEWVILKKKLAVQKESEALINIMIQSAEAHYAYNKEKLGTIYKAKAKLAELQSMVLMTENEIEQKIVFLNSLMNRDQNILFDVDTAYQVKNYVMPDSALISQNRSDLKAIDRSIEILKYKQSLERLKSNPDFGVRYDHMFAFGNANQFNLMAMMTLPLAPWSAKEYKANAKAIDFEIEEMELQKQSILNETAGKLSSLLLAIENSKRQVKIYAESILPALHNNFKTSQLAYEQNTEDLFVMLDAWEALNMAKMEYFNNVGALLSLQVEYERELEQK